MTIDYMTASIPLAADFDDARFRSCISDMGIVFGYHRKLWEYVYIYEHLRRANVLSPNARGLVFACGSEPLPSYFASRGCHIVATDGPPEITNEAWYRCGEHADGLEPLYRKNIIERDLFESRVSFEYCDMNHIPPHLQGFDFCWSTCSLEHLGSLRKGMDFIVNSVEKTLKPGGIAVHTTEFNLSSDEETIENTGCSVYRPRDIKAVKAELVTRGHCVHDIVIPEGAQPPDVFIDAPPYFHGLAHLKLQLEQYTVTSIGLVIRRGF